MSGLSLRNNGGNLIKSMKLYGNVKSERASKGQGGNEYLEVEILNEKQSVVATLRVTPEVNDGVKILVSHNPKLAEVLLGEKKRCECADQLCAKCLLVDCRDDECKVHPLIKKEEFRGVYKKR